MFISSISPELHALIKEQRKKQTNVKKLLSCNQKNLFTDKVRICLLKIIPLAKRQTTKILCAKKNCLHQNLCCILFTFKIFW